MALNSVFIYFFRMKARKRFLLLFFVAFLALIHFGLNRFRISKEREIQTDFYDLRQIRSLRTNQSRTQSSCRMSTCFDFTRCQQIERTGLRVHLYPQRSVATESASFSRIAEIIRNSHFFESDPQKACLFMATLWDPLDRDPLSRDFQRPHSAMTFLEPLFGGVNHVVFNLYSGSWPDYSELDWAYSHSFGKIQDILRKAILVKASQSRHSYRPGFDVSLPLFSRNHPTRGPPFVDSHLSPSSEAEKSIVSHSMPSRRLLVFKGKRYIYGIGSETRNALHYLNNDRDVLIVTTCKHGKKWKDWKDDKCEKDNSQYDKHDYLQLMANSTFCLVPRGRRLGSYRFLEALQLGCIPVVLSNGWVLPFEEIIDWKSCVVSADERLLLQIPETLRSFSQHKISRMRHKCISLFERFFASVERIVFTSLLIVEERIRSHLSLSLFASQLPLSPSLPALWQLDLIPPLSASCPQLSALILMTSSEDVSDLQKLIPRVLAMSVVREIFVLWTLPLPPPPETPHRVKMVTSQHNNRFAIESARLSTDAVVQLSPKSLLSEEEIAFAFSVWKSFPSRVIGFVAKSHYWREDGWQYSSKWANAYSLVEMDSSVYHKRFHDLFSTLNTSSDCPDLLFLFLVSHVTREGPLKVTQRKRSSSAAETYVGFLERKQCFKSVEQRLQYLPLLESKVRFDPLLFRDNVSVKRKKYLRIESQ